MSMTKPDTSPVERLEAFCAEAERRRARQDQNEYTDRIYGLGARLWLYCTDLRALLTELRVTRDERDRAQKACEHIASNAYAAGFEACREMAAEQVQHHLSTDEDIKWADDASERIRALQPRQREES